MSHRHYSKKRQRGEHLRYIDRQLLELLVKRNERLPKQQRLSQRKMAAILNAGVATINRELHRGRVEQLHSELWKYESYSAEVAQLSYEANATAKGPKMKIGNDHAFAAYVEHKILQQKYSPDAIIMELRREGNPFRTDISTRTLYQYIELGMIPNVEKAHLRREGKTSRQKHKRVRRAHNRDGKSIEARPKVADTRRQAGHWEMDCIESGKGKGRACLLSLVDRCTRELYLFKLSSQTQAQVLRALEGLERKLGSKKFRQKFQSITTDNGSEFSDWQAMERSSTVKGIRTAIYYAHPYQSSERGSNEHINGMVRWFVPKGSAISRFSHQEIAEIAKWINHLPRRILNGNSAKIASARAEASRAA